MDIIETMEKQLEGFKNEYDNYLYSKYDDENDITYDFDEALENVANYLKTNNKIKDYAIEWRTGFDSPGYTSEIIAVAILTNENKLRLTTFKKETY